MNQNTTQTAIVEQAKEWQDGAPLSVPSETLFIDIRTYRRVKCAGCGKPGMKAVPQHRGDDYRILCSCRVCRHTEAF